MLYSNQTGVLPFFSKFITALESPDRETSSDQAKRGTRQQQRRLTAEQTAELIERYLAGETIQQLARYFVIHRTTASNLLKRHGIGIRWRKITPALSDEAVRLYGSGLSLEAAGNQLGVTAGTVQKILMQRRIDRRPVGTNQWSPASVN